MSKKYIPAVLLLAGMGLVSITFQNCGPQGALVMEESGEGSFGSSGLDSDPKVAFDQRNEMKILTSDQVYRSMSSLTGVDLGNTAAQNDWRNNRTNSLSDNFSLNAVTPPLLLNLTNLAGIFCDEAIKAETATNATRRLFTGVNFQGQVNTLSGAAFTSYISNLSQIFWGRAVTAGEQTMLEQARTAHNASIAANQQTNVAETRKLVLMVCTAMLSSNDAFTF